MKKVMTLRDIVLMNIVAIIGLRWLPIAAGYGASAIALWVLAAIFFFLPVGLVSTELATAWPEEGGLYCWVKHAYGDRLGFLVSWFYWINSFFYLPALLTFVAVTLSFIFDPKLATNKIFICVTILAILWTVTLLNLRSMRVFKYISNIGAIGNMLPGIIIIILGFSAVFILKHKIPTDYSWSALVPKFNSSSNLAFLSALMFSMAGIEITPILAGETVNPQKTFPRATLISAMFIVGIYIIGTVAITFILPPNAIGSASGIMDALHKITTDIGFSFLTAVVAVLIVISGFGAMSVWAIAPIKMFFESTKKGVLPSYFTKLNKNDMPAHAMVAQSSVVTIVIIVTSFLPSVNVFYETLILMATITYFIPYIAMFAAFLKLRKIYPDVKRPYRLPGGKITAYTVTFIGLFSVIMAIVLPFITPPSDITSFHDKLVYIIELGTGPILFFVCGYLIYRRYERKKLPKNVV